MRSRAAWQAALAELIGVFAFVVLGAGAVLTSSGNVTHIALAHGLALAVVVAATARFSGGHINPAVTVAAFVTRRIGLVKGIMYVVAQLVGAAVAALFLLWMFPTGMEGNLGSHALAAGVSPGMGLLIEIVLTFFLVAIVFATAMDPKGPGHLAPFAIGIVVLVDHLVGVPLTGASMNPARSFGPALVSGTWANHWVYWVGPLVGGIIAGLVYEWVFLRWRVESSSPR
ncbi:MAG: MIP family channel protein [Chloroflexi bacterium]|nr:MIP family channel protein [Chloroflexota bacterium]